MREHFLIVTYARDLIIDGDLERLRTPLYALASYGYETVAPGEWMTGVARLQAAAKLTAESETLGAAAKGVATMARLCGQCHVDQGGPQMAQYRREQKGPSSDQLDARMARHAWAAELMWEGLIAPSDSAWDAGAAALSQAPVAAPTARPALPKSMVDGLRAVRGLGVRASSASSAQEREGVYSELLATCANCHLRRLRSP